MQLPNFVPILNADKSLYKRRAILLDATQDPGLHYEAGKDGKVQTWTCLVDYWRARGVEVPKSTCKWCEGGRGPWHYHYLPLITPDKRGKKYEAAMLQIRTEFEREYREELVRGRTLIIHGRGKGIDPGISVEDLLPAAEIERLPEPFECDAVLARIKLGYVPATPPTAATPRGEEILSFRRRRKA